MDTTRRQAISQGEHHHNAGGRANGAELAPAVQLSQQREGSQLQRMDQLPEGRGDEASAPRRPLCVAQRHSIQNGIYRPGVNVQNIQVDRGNATLGV